MIRAWGNREGHGWLIFGLFEPGPKCLLAVAKFVRLATDFWTANCVGLHRNNRPEAPSTELPSPGLAVAGALTKAQGRTASLLKYEIIHPLFEYPIEAPSLRQTASSVSDRAEEKR